MLLLLKLSFCTLKTNIPCRDYLELRLLDQIRLFDSQCIVRRPRGLVSDTEPNPLRYNLLFTLKDGTARMLGKARIHNASLRVNITKEDGVVRLRFDVNTRVAKVGVATYG